MIAKFEMRCVILTAVSVFHFSVTAFFLAELKRACYVFDFSSTFMLTYAYSRTHQCVDYEYDKKKGITQSHSPKVNDLM